MHLSHELIAAAHSGNLDEIERLRREGHDLNLSCENGEDLLYHYIWRNNVGPTDGLKSLIALGVRPANLNSQGGTPLTAAIWAHDSAWVQVLLDAGADPNVIAFIGDDESSALDTVLDDYCDCESESEFSEMQKNESLIRLAGGLTHRRMEPNERGLSERLNEVLADSQSSHCQIVSRLS